MLRSEQILYLSFPMSPSSPVPPAIQPMQIAPRMQLAVGDEANVYRVSFDNHANTHVDAPAHVIDSGLRITEFTAKDFLFDRPVVVDLPLVDAAVVGPEHLAQHIENLRDADIALFRFGYGPIRRDEPQRYVVHSPGFGLAGAEYLRQELPLLRAVGMDVPSFVCIDRIDETMQAHNVMLAGEGRRCLLIEDMDLEKDLSALNQVLLVPWLMNGIDSAPCTVLGFT